MRIAVLGGGSFGTSLAKLLADLDHEVVLWVRRPELAEQIANEKENRAYLPGVGLPAHLKISASLEEAAKGRELLLAAMPSHVLRPVMTAIREFVRGEPFLVSAAKGIEAGSLLRMTQVLEEIFGAESRGRIVALSGPSFAREIAQGMPTAVTAASSEVETARAVQAVFSGPRFRVYSSNDPIGVEIGGAVKNVIAIAAGVSDGLGLGSSSRAALITRGVAEVGRLVAKLGGDRQTVSGLSGVGDMVLTCTGDLSRNRTVGMRIGKGETLDEILRSMNMVAEGVHNSSTVCSLASERGVEMPISEQIRLMLHENKPARQVVGDLMGRQAKPEFWE